MSLLPQLSAYETRTRGEREQGRAQVTSRQGRPGNWRCVTHPELLSAAPHTTREPAARNGPRTLPGSHRPTSPAVTEVHPVDGSRRQAGHLRAWLMKPPLSWRRAGLTSPTLKVAELPSAWTPEGLHGAEATHTRTLPTGNHLERIHHLPCKPSQPRSHHSSFAVTTKHIALHCSSEQEPQNSQK